MFNKMYGHRFISRLCFFCRRNDGFGMNELLGIAAALIIAAFVLIPGLRTFSKSVMDQLSDWWGTTITGKLFPPS